MLRPALDKFGPDHDANHIANVENTNILYCQYVLLPENFVSSPS